MMVWSIFNLLFKSNLLQSNIAFFIWLILFDKQWPKGKIIVNNSRHLLLTLQNGPQKERRNMIIKLTFNVASIN